MLLLWSPGGRARERKVLPARRVLTATEPGRKIVWAQPVSGRSLCVRALVKGQ
jgi:hypothetical protein